MPTGYEVGLYRDVGRIATALERAVDALTTVHPEPVPSGLRDDYGEVRDAFVSALRDRDADLAADRLSLLDPDEAWTNWFGPLLDRIEEVLG